MLPEKKPPMMPFDLEDLAPHDTRVWFEHGMTRVLEEFATEHDFDQLDLVVVLANITGHLLGRLSPVGRLGVAAERLDLITRALLLAGRQDGSTGRVK